MKAAQHPKPFEQLEQEVRPFTRLQSIPERADLFEILLAVLHESQSVTNALKMARGKLRTYPNREEPGLTPGQQNRIAKAVRFLAQVKFRPEYSDEILEKLLKRIPKGIQTIKIPSTCF